MQQANQKAPAKQRVPNAERRRQSIGAVLDSALHLIVTQGYESTSIDDIATRAGLTKGAVYFYFKDKLSLLHALLERTEQQLLDPIFEEMHTPDLSARDRITMLTNWFARVGAERRELPLLHVLISLQMHGRDNIVEERVRATYEYLYRELTEVARQGQAAGEFSRDVPAEYQAAVIVSLIDGLLLEWHRREDQLDGELLAKSARRLILSGLSEDRTE